MKCPKCGTTNFNPRIKGSCLFSCSHATECLGGRSFDEWSTDKYNEHEIKRFAELKKQPRLR